MLHQRIWAGVAALLLSFALLTSQGYAAASRAVVTSGSMTTHTTDLNEELAQLFKVSSHPLDSVAGTNTVTASVASMPVLAAYTAGMSFTFKPVNTITGAATMNIDSVGAKSLVDTAGVALGSGDLVAGTAYTIQYFGGADDHFRLLTKPATAQTVNIQVFTTPGANTYTPTSGMAHVIAYCTGGGGGGGGADTDAADFHVGAGGGGGAGGTAIEEYSAGTIGASQTVTIGAAGAAGSATNGANGGAGGNTTFGALMTATGGALGTGSGVSASQVSSPAGGAGGIPTNGDINITGGGGTDGLAVATDGVGFNSTAGTGGQGGPSYWGGGGIVASQSQADGSTDDSQAGNDGTAYGSGGGGGVVLTTATGVAGGAGKAGVCVVYEFIGV
jgi:hypothetical protein